jgi:hypothetical protein
MKRSFAWAGGILLALCLCGGATLAGPPDGELPWEKTTAQWMETIPSGGTIRIINPFGNVYARFGGYEGRVELLANSQQIDDNLPGLEVRREHIGTRLEIRVVPEGEEGTGGRHDHRDRVDLVIFVPKGVTLDVQTEDGDIEATGLMSDLIATSITGDIYIRKIRGHVRLDTARGQITAALLTGVSEMPQQLSTVTGEIEVHVWEDADLQVVIATSGMISTDFSVDIEHLPFKEPGKHARATIGQGGPELQLLSKRGSIRLLRMQKNFLPDGS